MSPWDFHRVTIYIIETLPTWYAVRGGDFSVDTHNQPETEHGTFPAPGLKIFPLSARAPTHAHAHAHAHSHTLALFRVYATFRQPENFDRRFHTASSKRKLAEWLYINSEGHFHRARTPDKAINTKKVRAGKTNAMRAQWTGCCLRFVILYWADKAFAQIDGTQMERTANVIKPILKKYVADFRHWRA